jgi:hypothetical protein
MCKSKAEGGRRCQPKKGRGSPAAAGGSGGTAPSAPGRRRRSRAAVLKAAQKQLGDLLDAAVDAAPVDSAAALGAVAAADVADQIADAITATLEAHGCPRGSWQDHLLCGALAAVARAMQAAQDQAAAAVARGVTAALVASGVPPQVADLAGRAAADALAKMDPVRHFEDARRAVQMLAVAACPKVADHPEVERYCLQPLASAMLSSAIQQELAESLHDGGSG